MKRGTLGRVRESPRGTASCPGIRVGCNYEQADYWDAVFLKVADETFDSWDYQVEFARWTNAAMTTPQCQLAIEQQIWTGWSSCPCPGTECGSCNGRRGDSVSAQTPTFLTHASYGGCPHIGSVHQATSFTRRRQGETRSARRAATHAWGGTSTPFRSAGIEELRERGYGSVFRTTGTTHRS